MLVAFDHCIEGSKKEIFAIAYPKALAFTQPLSPQLVKLSQPLSSHTIKQMVKFVKNMKAPIITTLKIYERYTFLEELNELDTNFSEELQEVDEVTFDKSKTQFFTALRQSGELGNFAKIILELKQVSPKEIMELTSVKFSNLNTIQFNKIGFEGLKTLSDYAPYFSTTLINIYVESDNDRILKGIIPIFKAFPQLKMLDVTYDKFAPREHQYENHKIAKYCQETNTWHLFQLHPPICLDAVDSYTDIQSDIMGESDQLVPSHYQ